jgi:diketogulonate reductase-like aldo/keto reductase
MVDRIRDVRGGRVPSFMYGTAWKEDATKGLVREALRAGFRAIDTANQRKHYHEAGVGAAIADAMDGGDVTRDELFLQTKFTFVDGQDHRLPYDPRAPIAEQVGQSFQSSLEHLGVAMLDSYVLHGPSQARGLGDADREAWSAMESLHAVGRVRLLGVSNVTAEQLELLCEIARVKPAFVQNRCYAARGWDAAVRAICDREGLVYQGFSLLTANRHVLAGELAAALARKHGRTPAQMVFRLAIELGMLPLTGTTSRAHMDEDLSVYEFALGRDEVDVLLNAR